MGKELKPMSFYKSQLTDLKVAPSSSEIGNLDLILELTQEE
jgi:hypothetical protein